MATVMSACGVLCSECPAYLGKARGAAHQKRTAAVWPRHADAVRARPWTRKDDEMR